MYYNRGFGKNILSLREIIIDELYKVSREREGMKSMYTNLFAIKIELMQHIVFKYIHFSGGIFFLLFCKIYFFYFNSNLFIYIYIISRFVSRVF